MSKKNETIKNKNSINQNSDKVDLGYNLELERKNQEVLSKKEYDFIPRFNHLLSSEEQKLKVNEIENKTK